MPEDPAALSYFVASLLQAELPEKQALLEEPSTTARLRRELEVLDSEAVTLREHMERRLLA